MKPKIALIGLTAELYQRKIPDLVKDLSSFSHELKRVVNNFAEVIHIPVVYTKQQMEEAYLKLEKEEIEGIILVFLSYSPSLIITPILKKYRNIPVLLWNTQKLSVIDEKFRAYDTSLNHGMHGIQDTANVLFRENIEFSLVTGHYKNKDILVDIKKWCKAAYVAKLLKKVKIARIGGRFKDMGDFLIPDERITLLLGPKIVEIPVEEIAKESLKIKDNEIEKVMESDRREFKIDESLDRNTHFISSRTELALRKIISREKLNGLGISFMAFRGKEGCEAIPFAAISKLIAEGLGYAGEGDVLCAASVLILQRLCGKANFVEMFTTDYENNRVLMLHMGESNLKMAKEKRLIRVVKKEMEIIKPGLATAMFLFPLKPGQVTLFNIAPNKEGFKFIVSKKEVLDEPLFEDVNSPHFLLKVSGDIGDFLTNYSLLGGTHHLAMAYGDRRQDLKFLSQIMEIPIFEV